MPDLYLVPAATKRMHWQLSRVFHPAWRVAVLAVVFLMPSHAGAQEKVAHNSSNNSNTNPDQLVPGRFVDVADKAGVKFQHQAPHTSRKYLIETMGSGVALSTATTTAVSISS